MIILTTTTNNNNTNTNNNNNDNDNDNDNRRAPRRGAWSAPPTRLGRPRALSLKRTPGLKYIINIYILYISFFIINLIHILREAAASCPGMTILRTPGLHNKIPAWKISPGAGLLRNRLFHR